MCRSPAGSRGGRLSSMGSEPESQRFISNVLLLLARQPAAFGQLSNLVNKLRSDWPRQDLWGARLGSSRRLQQGFSGKQRYERHHLLGGYFDPVPVRKPGEEGVVSAGRDDAVLVNDIVADVANIAKQLVADVKPGPGGPVFGRAGCGRPPDS